MKKIFVIQNNKTKEYIQNYGVLNRYTKDPNKAMPYLTEWAANRDKETMIEDETDENEVGGGHTVVPHILGNIKVKQHEAI